MLKISNAPFISNFLKDKRSSNSAVACSNICSNNCSPRNKNVCARPQNSISDPFKIVKISSFINGNTRGGLNISACPGKKDKKWDRDLLQDLKIIKENRIDVIVCLLEWNEMEKLDVYDYPHLAQKEGILFFHLPIKDRGTPNVSELQTLIPFLVKHLKNGYNILVHCRSGLGRSGLICSCCFTHFGYTGEEAILLVREKRKGAVQTISQEELIKNYYKLIVQ